MRQNLTRLLVEEAGISSVEYAILLAFIAAALITVVTGLSAKVVIAFNAACQALSGANCG
jgi:Flp pilus assembly pilin Flp